MPRRRILVVLIVLLLTAGLAGLGCCTPAGYYAREARDGVRFLTARRPIDKVLADPETDDGLRRQLEIAVAAREFAVSALGLPDNKSYRHYADLGRPYASWIVTAAPELSLAPVQWCFPIAGCVTYRGYFSPRRAERFAGKLRRRGSDVDVSGVAAFSTLGWLADPVLSTFVHQPPAALAGLIFHELAHQRLYVRDDTRFNESFATFVELEGVDRWLAATGREADREAFESGKTRQRELTELLAVTRERLAELYGSARSDEVKRARKTEIFAGLERDVASLREKWGFEADGDGDPEEWNNADLVAVQAYWDLVPAFRRLHDRAGGDLERFYASAEALAALDPAERQARLDELTAASAAAR